MLANFDNYALPPSEIRGLFERALHTAEAYGEEAILERNRRAAQEYRQYLEDLERERRKPKKREPRPGYVYIIEGEGAYKIGRARNVKDRVKQFGIKLPFRCDWHGRAGSRIIWPPRSSFTNCSPTNE